MRIAWIGFHEEGLPAFRNALEKGFEIVGFITLDDDAMNKRSAGSREYLDLCEKYGVPFFLVHTIKNDQAYEVLSGLSPDLVVVLGWSEILPERLLQIPHIGTVGAHAALLPHNRGSAPINWSLIRGEKQTGNTLMWLKPEVDAGEIIDQMAFDITPYDSCKTLYAKVADTNQIMIERLVTGLMNGSAPSMEIPNETEEPLLPRRKPKDGLIQWAQSGRSIYNFIRALTDPYPGAFTWLEHRKWLLWKASLLPVDSKKAGLKPGEIGDKVYSFIAEENGILVGTEDMLLILHEVEDEQGIRYSGKALHDLGLKGVFTCE